MSRLSLSPRPSTCYARANVARHNKGTEVAIINIVCGLGQVVCGLVLIFVFLKMRSLMLANRNDARGRLNGSK